MARKHGECKTRGGGCGGATGSTWTGAVGGMQGGMRRERVEWVYLNGARVQVVLVGVVNINVAGSRCSVVVGSRGESMRAWRMKVGS